jgi:pyruvate/2-oxoglutarate dehydrogenase complex dihydrolipoamide dehydrogenase (E3) component
VLIERAEMGGDCLNVGCVPSKSLIAAAHAAHAVRTGARFGVNGHEPDIDFLKVRGHVRDVIAGIAPHDGVERFEGLGVTVIRDHARFTSRDEVKAGDARVRARRFVVATGSRPLLPPVAGLSETPHLTNETIFDLGERPGHLVVLGGGSVGVELAQAHRRLGAAVTVLENGSILSKDDSEAVQVVRSRLLHEGISLREGAKVLRTTRRGDGVAVTAEIDGRGGGGRRVAPARRGGPACDRG